LIVDVTETIDSVGESLFKEMEDAVTQSKRALHKAMKVPISDVKTSLTWVGMRRLPRKGKRGIRTGVGLLSLSFFTFYCCTRDIPSDRYPPIPLHRHN
jgi:hypothetical protein